MLSWRWAVGALLTGLFSAVPAAIADDGMRLTQTCAGCHGTNGVSPGETIPSLAGQQATYIADSMRAFRDGERDYYVMNMIAKAFTDDEIATIANWFANQEPAAIARAHDSEIAKGASEFAWTVCASCHGDKGEGLEGMPLIAGQGVAYLNEAMQAYKTGKRRNQAAGLMVMFKDLDDAKIAALANFYAGPQDHGE